MRTIFEFDYKDYVVGGTVGRRPSVRGVAIRDGRIAMIYSSKYEYYAFPGGGIEESESQEHALIREMKEETGLTVIPDSIEEYGLVVRKEKGAYEDLFIQENYFYLCRVEASVVEQKLESYEEEEGYELRWVYPEEAIKFNKENPHKDAIDGRMWAKHLIERETAILQRMLDDKIFNQ